MRLPKYAVRHPDRLQRTYLSFENFGKRMGLLCRLLVICAVVVTYCWLDTKLSSNTPYQANAAR
jgi:hypothetical protein